MMRLAATISRLPERAIVCRASPPRHAHGPTSLPGRREARHFIRKKKIAIGIAARCYRPPVSGDAPARFLKRANSTITGKARRCAEVARQRRHYLQFNFELPPTQPMRARLQTLLRYFVIERLIEQALATIRRQHFSGYLERCWPPARAR